MFFAFPTGNTEGTVKCYIVNKQRNRILDRFLAAPAPAAVEDENFEEAREPMAPAAAPLGDFLARMESKLDKKMNAQSAGMRNDLDKKMNAQSADIRNDLVALEGQLIRSGTGPLKKEDIGTV